jgi:phospholipid/cholesterol/gamma-HCH transport system permease protein
MRIEADALIIDVGGAWQLRAPRPDVAPLFAEAGDRVRRVAISAHDLGDWDSSLLLFVLAVRRQAADRGWPVEIRHLPSVFNEWLAHLESKPAAKSARPDPFPITRRIGRWTQIRADRVHLMLSFLGECALAAGRLLARPTAFRWGDTLEQMRRCGAQALGIVALITFLVGVILAFVGTTQFRQYGADVYVADLVGFAILREMGAMMAAIVLAGRTGAAYAAELGNMRLNEEIDALETFGLRSVDFLVLPRLVALTLMMPLLAVYADLFGLLGGAFVCGSAIDMPPETYFLRIREAVDVKSFFVGVTKSVFFGLIIAYSGCLKGMHSARSATGVGDATTSAVVLSILLIIVADAIFTVIFHFLQW